MLIAFKKIRQNFHARLFNKNIFSCWFLKYGLPTDYLQILCYFSNLIHFFIFLIYLQFSSYNFLYMFRTGWSIVRRIKLHAQPLVPFPVT